jgi:type I restriction enzyme S subunit
MSKLEKYISYKDSGVEWLGEIPEYWEVKKIKHLFSIGRGRVISQQELDEDGLFPVYSSQTKNNGVLGYIKTYDYDCKQITWTTDGANAGTVFLREGKHNCTNVCGTLQNRNKNEILEFVNYSLQIAAQFYKRPDTNGAKIMNNEMARISITYPPKEEQTKIASFLDEKTAQIDNAISQKEKLIELLKERRQITINEAVTKGLDKAVEFKDSGVEWIGEIPKHWEINRLKFLFKIRKRIASSLGYDVLSITQKGIKVKDIDSGEGQLAMDYSKYQLAFKGDFAMNHMDLLTGYIDISKFDGVISPDYRVFTLEDSNCVPEYYLRLFQMCYHEKIFYAFGQGVSQLGRWRFPADNFNNFFIPIPPKDEQLQIVEYIENQTTKIDKAIELQQNYISKLKEYKASLIDSVVTGKVRVA